MQKFIGLGIIILSVFGGFYLAGGNLAAMWQPCELLIILGAGIGSMVIANPKHVLVEIKKQLLGSFKKGPERAEVLKELMLVMHALLDLVRSQGLKAIDEHVEDWETSSLFLQYTHIHSDPLLIHFITDNFRMLSMGKISAHELDDVLESEIQALEEDLLKPSEALHTTGEAMPGFGILAAVMGIIITMSSLDGPLMMIGLHVGAALVGTFLGIFMCYCLFEPLGESMAHKVHNKIMLLECVKTIMVTHVSGKSPVLSIDAGRKLIDTEIKPSFVEMEKWLDNRAS